MRNPNQFASCMAALFLSAGILSVQGDVVERHNVSRYQKIWEVSPFVAVTDLSGKVDDMTGRFVLTGFARMGEEPMAFVFDRTSLERFAITPTTPKHGLSLERIDFQGDTRSMRAVVRSGAGGTMELAYDPSAIPAQAQPQPQPPQAGGGMPDRSQRGRPSDPRSRGVPPASPNQIIGGSPSVEEEAPPQPRRVIRRRGIVAPE